MRKLILALLLFGNVAFVHATTIEMKLENVSPGNNDGSYYVYPYNFSLNNSPTLTALICDDFNDEVYFYESWTANVYTIGDILQGQGQMNPLSGALVAVGQRNQAYEDAAWLYQQLIANPTGANSVLINHAIWGLFAPTQFNGNADVTSLLTQANLATASLTDSQARTLFSNVVFYTPILGSQPLAYGRPQEFIGTAPVPEPASLILLGTGLTGLFVVRRRRLSTAGKTTL